MKQDELLRHLITTRDEAKRSGVWVADDASLVRRL